MIFRKKSKKIATWLMFIGGLFAGGFIAGLVREGMTSISTTTSGFLGGALGIGAGGVMTIIAVIVCLELWHSMHPKKGKASGFHPFLALAAPALLVGAGGIFGRVIGSISTGLGHMSSHVSSLF